MANYVLEILDGDHAGEALTLSGRLSIGRKAGNDLVVTDEKASGSHAEIVLDGERYVLRDLQSTNGTIMEGRRISEVVLTQGDVFQIGRVRIRFRAEGAGVEDEDGLTMHRVDQARLKRAGRPRSALLIGALAVIAAGAGAWQLLGRGPAGSAGAGTRKSREPLLVAGNRLPGNAGTCEDETGWMLRAGGAGFGPSSRANSGQGALEAVGIEAEGVAPPGFALCRLAEPLTVLAGKSLTLAAHLRTQGTGLVGVRLRFFSSAEGNPFQFRVGTPLQQCAEWVRVECQAAVPQGADRVEVELVAALPGADAVAVVDDIALTDAGAAQALSLQLETTGQTLLGAGGGVALRSTDAAQPAILLGLRPDVGQGPLLPLYRAGLSCLSDVGASVQAEKNERSFALTLGGASSAVLEFPAEVGEGLLVRPGQGAFGSAPSEGEFTAQQVLLGDGRTRCMLALEAPVTMEGKRSGGILRLRVQANRLELVLNFRAERQAAQEVLRNARGRAGEEPGAALDQLRELQRNLPHDTVTLREATALRTELAQALSDRLAQLRVDLDEATFFDTRGGFERVVEGLDAVGAAYGRQNLEDAEALDRDRGSAMTRIQQLDEARTADARTRLTELAKLFDEGGQADLAKLVRDYLGGK